MKTKLFCAHKLFLSKHLLWFVTYSHGSTGIWVLQTGFWELSVFLNAFISLKHVIILIRLLVKKNQKKRKHAILLKKVWHVG